MIFLRINYIGLHILTGLHHAKNRDAGDFEMLSCERRYARRERIRQQYSAIAADKLYSDVPPTVADDDYAPGTTSGGLSTVHAPLPYVKTSAVPGGVGLGRSPLRRPAPPHVWQLPLPQPRDDVVAVTSSAYGGSSIDSRYYVLDHNLDGGSVIPTNDDIQFVQ